MFEAEESPASNHLRDTRTLFRSAQGQAYNPAMPRKLVWIKSQNVQGFSCSECQWLFMSSSALVGKTFDQMKQAYEAEGDKEFAAHACAKFPRAINPKK